MKEFAYETKAMGCEVSVSFVTDSPTDAQNARDYAFATITAYEQCFSRFLPDSELSILNRAKSLQVSDMFYEVCSTALTLSKQTRHAFNPLVHIAHFGYTDDFSTLHTTIHTNKITQYNTNIQEVTMNAPTRTITLQNDQQLDFGGIVKGFLAEKIARTLEETYATFQGIIINIGGDLHARGHDEEGDVFTFYIYNPVTKTEHPIPIHNQSLTTSGTYKRTWKTNKGTLHHLLNATGTGNATEPIISASVIGENGAHCEAYTKTLINLPLQTAKQLLSEQHLKFLAIHSTGEITTNI